MAKSLVNAGADLTILNQAGCYGTALHYAITKANPDMVKFLIAKGSDVNQLSGKTIPYQFTSRLVTFNL